MIEFSLMLNCGIWCTASSSSDHFASVYGFFDTHPARDQEFRMFLIEFFAISSCEIDLSDISLSNFHDFSLFLSWSRINSLYPVNVI